MNDLPATPCLVIDLPTVQRNLTRLADYAAAHRIALRPHTKTHKSLRMARLQMGTGSIGLTVAKAGEAAVMAQVAPDLLMAYPPVDLPRTRAVAELARRIPLIVGLDTQYAARVLADAARSAGSTVGVLVDLDVGLHRTGVQSPAAALQLAQWIDREPGLTLKGLMIYPGHIGRSVDARDALLTDINARLDEAADLWDKSGLNRSIISGGSTPSAMISHLMPRVTEIRAGTYIYHDMNCLHAGLCTLDDCAARVHTTVVSDAVPGQILIDAGSKALTSDPCGPAPDAGFGRIVEFPQAKIVKLNEEHGWVDVRACDKPPAMGQRLTVVPNHICVCVNMQDQAWVREADGLLTPLPIDTRGMLS